MNLNLEIVPYINYIFAVIFILCVGYQFIYIFVPFMKGGRKLKTKKMYHYAVLIPARNEEKVIPHLIASIKGQTYPSDMIDIFVIADNCTDNTAKAAMEAGAFCVYQRENKELVGKGYALDFALAKIREDYPDNDYAGYFVFDADNLLDERYIEEMNKMFSNGKRIITSYRNTKNYGTSWVSAGCSLWYLRESRFLNHPRTLLNTSCAISGTGFLVHREVLEKVGGWKFFLLTEDIEFTLHHVLEGECISYCDKAVLYDEQPVKFKQSWRQRMRWTKGSMQVTQKYFFKMVKGIFTGKGFACFDLAVATMIPLILTVLAFAVYVVFITLGLIFRLNVDVILRSLLETFVNSYFMLLGIGAVTTISEWTKIFAPMRKKILYTFTFPFFMLTYIPITIVALFTKNVSWKPIYHLEAKSLNDVR
ncbi:glycosyltransferase [Congzhengia sp.]|mgnify:FL=1|jgi:cellulose synthase/poly-beta-1,6-N-acetylglucosamine synthase-like glycosyltransferase|uniref:glycosyltransferase n=1 Tax=Congzhengia sp. TaxID=2944168 RepID=UPI000E8060D0|nr:glycosyltransferase [Clostridiales bacterium]HBL81607.1 N-acetylglucosaminyltransferase [Clostridiales bacterium]